MVERECREDKSGGGGAETLKSEAPFWRRRRAVVAGSSYVSHIARCTRML